MSSSAPALLPVSVSQSLHAAKVVEPAASATTAAPATHPLISLLFMYFPLCLRGECRFVQDRVSTTPPWPGPTVGPSPTWVAHFIVKIVEIFMDPFRRD